MHSKQKESFIEEHTFAAKIPSALTAVRGLKYPEDLEDRALCLANYFSAFKEILPDTFEHPENFSLWKSGGINVFLSIFPLLFPEGLGSPCTIEDCKKELAKLYHDNKQECKTCKEKHDNYLSKGWWGKGENSVGRYGNNYSSVSYIIRKIKQHLASH